MSCPVWVCSWVVACHGACRWGEFQNLVPELKKKRKVPGFRFFKIHCFCQKLYYKMEMMGQFLFNGGVK
jgi:hypothetical protein